MEFDNNTYEPTAKQRMLARNVMATNPEMFEVPDECADCVDLNRMQEEIALDNVMLALPLAGAATALCHFKDTCSGAIRSSDGEWQSCGSWSTPAG